MNLSDLVVPPWLTRVWTLLPWASTLGLGVALALTSAGHRVARADWERDSARTEASAARTLAANRARKTAAVENHERTTVRMQPIILQSKAAVDAYAQTPAGRAACLGVDRVQQILAARSALFAVAAGGSTEPVPAGPTLPDAAVER